MGSLLRSGSDDWLMTMHVKGQDVTDVSVCM